jgi:hypothetical protein
MRRKISTGLTIHNKLFLSTISHSSVSMGPMPNTSPIGYPSDPHASLFQLTGIKRELLVVPFHRFQKGAPVGQANRIVCPHDGFPMHHHTELSELSHSLLQIPRLLLL